MPNTHSTLTSLFGDIADAIRAKTGESGEIVADAFPGAIAAIPTGGTKPSYLISDGDTVSAFYFNTAYDLDSFLAGLTYADTDPVTGLDVCWLGIGFFFAVDLTGGEYAVVWNDGTNVVPIYTTSAVPAYGVTAAGWQVASYTPSTSATIDASYIPASFKSIMDSVIAKDGIAFGGSSGKAHTFAVPTVSGDFTYNGSAKTPTVSGYYSDFMTESGNTSATNAGTYTITFALKDTANCQWSDGTIGNKSCTWSIAKATPSAPVLSAGILTLSTAAPSGSFTVTRQGNGTVYAASSDPTAFSVSVSGTTVTVTALSPSIESTEEITVTVGEGSNYVAYTSTNVKCSVTTESIITKTTAFVTVAAANAKLPIALTMDSAGTMTVDWGDGNTNQYTATSDVLYITASHTYAAAGDYRVSFETAGGVTWTPGANYKASGESFATTKNFLNVVATGSAPSNIALTKFVTKGDIVGIRGSAFYEVSTLAEVDLDTSVTSIGQSAFRYTGLTSFTIPSSVTTLNEGIFANTSLTSITVHDAVTSINNTAFGSCTSLVTATVGSGVTSMRASAFSNCSHMTSFTIKATTPPTVGGANFMYLVPADCIFYVPANSVSTYQATSPWSNRADYIRAIQE